jgi:hypothetical protein
MIFMDSQNISQFEPPRRSGLLFQIGAIIVLSAGALLLFIQATLATLGPQFLAFLLVSLLLATVALVFAFRTYSLIRSSYVLERDGIRLQWGFRIEDIPIDQVLWVRLAEDLQKPLPKPRLRWPGAVVGVRWLEEIGQVEFMAANETQLVLIGTPERVFAISPSNREQFLQAFQLQTELGSLTPIQAFSTYPTFLFSELWESPLGRAFLITSLVLSLGLFIWVGMTVPNLESVSLGYSPTGSPWPPVPAVQLFLLPVLNILLTAVGFIYSLYFYRREMNHPLAIVLWVSTALTNFLFLTGVFFILQNS